MSECDVLYQNALENTALTDYHSIRVGAVLNYSVHLYEIKEDAKKAIEISEKYLKLAKDTIHEADSKTSSDT